MFISLLILQHAREEEIAERKAMKRAERDIARKKEYVRRVRLQIEDKRAEVRLQSLCVTCHLRCLLILFKQCFPSCKALLNAQY